MRSRTSSQAHDFATQLAVLTTVQTRALDPARRAGWAPLVLADVSTPHYHERRFESVVRGSLGAMHVRFRALEETQTASLLSTLQWAVAVAGSTSWGAYLLLRADLEIKATLQLPSPTDSQSWKILVPFRVPFGPAAMADLWRNYTAMGPLVADTLHFVPRCRHDELAAALAPAAAWRHSPGRHRPSSFYSTLHWLCAWLGVGIDYWSVGIYDGNSMHEANPIYRQSGRPEGPRKPPTSGTKGVTPTWACGARAADYEAAVARTRLRCAARGTSKCTLRM